MPEDKEMALTADINDVMHYRPAGKVDPDPPVTVSNVNSVSDLKVNKSCVGYSYPCSSTQFQMINNNQILSSQDKESLNNSSSKFDTTSIGIDGGRGEDKIHLDNDFDSPVEQLFYEHFHLGNAGLQAICDNDYLCSRDIKIGFTKYKNYAPIVNEGYFPVYKGPREVHKIGGQVSEWRVCAWDFELQKENDLELKKFIEEGVKYGFRIVDSNVCIPSYQGENYSSSTKGVAKPFIDKIFEREVSEGKLLQVNKKPRCIHSIGAVPKPDGRFRQIIDCSLPELKSINNFMSSTAKEFNFRTVDNVIDLITPNCWMASLDIKDAYRTVVVHPDQWKFQGLEWEMNGISKFFTDCRLCFGGASSPYIFSQLSNFLVRCMHRRGMLTVINYLDDFWMCAPSFEECYVIQNTMIQLLISLGFSINWSKCCGPVQVIKYLGLNFDSVKLSVTLPEDKLKKLDNELTFFKGRKRASRKQIQKLCGILANAARVVRGGRTHSRRLIEILRGLPSRGNPRLKLDSEFQKDIDWWFNFTRDFNGAATMIKYNFGNGPYMVSDSSKSGYGFYSNDCWQAGFFNSDSYPEWETLCKHEHCHWENVNFDSDVCINVLELVPVWLAVKKFSNIWENLHVVCYVDNTQVVSMINKGISKSVVAMDMLRSIFWICAKSNIYLTARHISSSDNLICDYLSRLTLLTPASSFPKFLCCSSEIRGSGENCK